MLSKVVDELLSKISQLVVDSKGDREAQKFLKRVELFIIEKESNSVDDIDYDSDVENFYSDDSENEDAENEDFAPEKSNRGKQTYIESIYDLDTLKAIIQLKDEGWSFKRIRDRYTMLSEYSCIISRIREIVENNGTKFLKYKELRRRVYEAFEKCKQNKLVITDRDLAEFALNIAEDLGGLDDFKASPSWVFRFKKEFRLVSRKITKIVSMKNNAKERDIEKLSDDFLKRVSPLFDQYPHDKIFNTDQMGINLEMHTGRTLHKKGAKVVEAAVQRINATKHSYTIQPLISAAGILQKPLLVCFYQPSGIPKKFQQELAEFTNLKCVGSESGILDSKLVIEWTTEVLLPNIPNDSLILLDSWGGFKKAMALPKIEEKGLRVEVIPPKTTWKIQPLDVFFNRQFKTFLRRLSDKIRRHNPRFELAIRKNIASLISQVFQQFCAPRFVNFIKYPWTKSGYIDQRPPPFQTPPEFCLDDFPYNSKCQCGKINLIRCAYCQEFICFDHFIIDRHTC